MIQKLIKSILLVLLTNSLFAQHTFEEIISGPENQIINSVIEDDDGNFIMVGRIHNVDTQIPAGYIIKIDSYGKILLEKIIMNNDTTSSLFLNIHFYGDYYYLLGTTTELSSNEIYKLWFVKLNMDLEVISQKELGLPNDKWFSYFNSIIDSDTNIVLAGYTTKWNGNNSIHNDPAFYKLNIDGDSITSFFMTEPPQRSRLAFDIIENIDNTMYYAFVSRFENSSSGQKLILNRNLDSISIQPIPIGIFDFYSPVYITDSTLLLCGHGSPYQSELYSLNAITINDQTELLDYNHFEIGDDMREQPAMYNGVSKNVGNIYIGGTSNFDYSNPFWSTKDSWFHLIKVNPDISPIWEYWYGGDTYYQLYSILATNDGGCLLVGNRYDDAIQFMERDIYIVKVNGDGIITWEQEITVDNQITSVFPNPGTNLLNLKTNNEVLDFELININGQTIIKQIVDNNYQTINTELLKSGIYFYRLINKQNNTIETGKWIKK